MVSMFGQPPDDLLEPACDAAGERREAFGEEQNAQRFVCVVVVNFVLVMETIRVGWTNERENNNV